MPRTSIVQRKQRVRIDFLAWNPDQDAFNNPGLTVATNTIHQPGGYKQLKSQATVGSKPVGTATILAPRYIPFPGNDDDLTESIYVGVNATSGGHRIYASANGGTSWTKKYTGSGSVSWVDYAQYDDHVVAAFGGSSANNAVNTDNGSLTSIGFSSDLLGVIGDFVIAGRPSGYGDEGAHAVRWCNIGDPTTWATPGTDAARAAQAGIEFLDPVYGTVTGIAGGQFFGYILQQRGIVRVTYVGGDGVFRFQYVSRGIGCYSVNNFCQVEDLVFFESASGYYMLQGGAVVDIGKGVVAESYPPEDHEAPNSYIGSVHANPAINCVFWTAGLIYNYKSGYWTIGDDISPRYSINNDAGVIGELTSNGKLSLRTGSAKQATFTTQETDPNPAGRALVTGIRPIINNPSTLTNVVVRVGSNDQYNNSHTFSPSSTVNNTTFKADVLWEGRNLRAEVKVSGGFTRALGLDVEFIPQGIR